MRPSTLTRDPPIRHLLQGDCHEKLGNQKEALAAYNVAANLPDGEAEAEPQQKRQKRNPTVREDHKNADSLNIGFGELDQATTHTHHTTLV